MSDPALALQGAIVATLKAAATGAGNRIYDDVPTGAAFPYITLGEAQTVANRADCYDGSEVFLDVNVWSRAVGYPEVKTIASQVRTTLHDAALTLTGHVLDLIEVRDATYTRDPDGKTRRARITVRALTHPDS